MVDKPALRVSPAGGQRRGRSLRFRLTLVATAVVAAVLSISAFGLHQVQDWQLTAILDASLEQRADTIAQTLDSSSPATLANTNDEDRAAQVVALSGPVIAATPNLAGAAPLTHTLGSRDQVIATRRDLPLEDDAYRVLSRRLDTPDGPAVLHVAENSDDLNDAIRGLAIALSVAVPVVVLVLTWLIWWLTGRTLRPVDDIRAEVDSITTDQADQRVRVPERDDEISRLATTMNHMLDRQAEATEHQRRFVADAAHELRTPLTRMRTEVEVDLAQPDRADLTATHRAVLEEVSGLQRLIDDLLHLARTDAGRSPRAFSPVDLDDVVLGEVRPLRASAPDVDIDTSGIGAAHVRGDADELGRAVGNLLSNASRHAESTVTVTLREGMEAVELAVCDDGEGVPPDQREGIFDRFARVDDARSRTQGGAGLGLPIAREIVERHGGSLVCEDPGPSAGACFVLTLPTLRVPSNEA